MSVDEDEEFNEFKEKFREPFSVKYKVGLTDDELFSKRIDFRTWHQKISFFSTYKPFYEPRRLELPNYSEDKYCTNKIQNNKYTWYSFLPLAYLSQFKNVCNIFFLLTIITQFFPESKVGYLFQHLVPFLVVLTIAVCKEA